MTKQLSFEEMWKIKCDLDPELEAHLEQTNVGLMLRHPLVYCIMYCEQENYRLNLLFKQKKELLEKARKAGDWGAVIWVYERPYRLQALFSLTDEKIPPKEFGRLIAAVWTDSENIWQDREGWQMLLAFVKDETRFGMMNDKERAVWDKLNERFTIYRGTRHNFDHGLSYTLDPEKAKWFAMRFYIKGDRKFGDPVVIEREVMKSDCIAYMNSRKEQEIIIRPRILKVTKKQMTKVTE